jgi:hypothetical protein
VNWSGSGLGPVEGSCEHGDEPSGSIEYWNILEQLNNWRLLEMQFSKAAISHASVQKVLVSNFCKFIGCTN